MEIFSCEALDDTCCCTGRAWGLWPRLKMPQIQIRWGVGMDPRTSIWSPGPSYHFPIMHHADNNNNDNNNRPLVDSLQTLGAVWPTWLVSDKRSGPESPAAVAAGDDEDVGTHIDSGAVSKGTSRTVTIWSSPRQQTPDYTPNLERLTLSAVLSRPEWQKYGGLMGDMWPDVTGDICQQ